MKKEQLVSQLELKNFKAHKGHDYFDGFSATLLFNGIKIASVYDDSYGGGYQYDRIGNDNKLKELYALCKQLPKIESEVNGEPLTYHVDLDFLIDELVNGIKVKKDEKKGIVIKSKNGWEILGWTVSIPTMLKKYKAESIIKELQADCDKLKKDGETILNGAYLKSIGVNL